MMHTMSVQPGKPEEQPAERTTVTLPAQLARALRAQSRARGRSVSSIVREALQAYFEGQEPPELPSFAGVGRSGRHDLSERVEELIAEHLDRGREH